MTPSCTVLDRGVGVVLLDSSFLVAYHNTSDVHHSAAARAMVHLVGGRWGRGLLAEYVFLEVVTVLLARRGLAAAADVGSTLLAAREVDFLPGSDLFLEAWRIFRGQSGRLSFTDSALVAAARRHSVEFIATFDADFRGIEGLSVVPD